jgi:Protein of unknown function (DUF723)
VYTGRHDQGSGDRYQEEKSKDVTWNVSDGIMTRMARYTSVGMEKIRKGNCERFLRDARAKYCDKFDYSRVVEQYQKQKSRVEIGCPIHGFIQIAPDNHLRDKSNMGCPKCGINARAGKRTKAGEKRFREEFARIFGKRFVIVGEYRGAHEVIRIQCIRHRIVFGSTPTSLISGNVKHGCQECLVENRWIPQRMTGAEYVKRIAEKYGSQIIVAPSDYNGMNKPIRAVCIEHGLFTAYSSTLYYRSIYGCMKCAKLHMGYAGYRLERIERGEVQSRRATRIALMEVEVFGIKSYKLGITYRSLESRYKENVKAVMFDAVLDEYDALRLEQTLHSKYNKLRDTRVFKAGMRNGERWSGDSELYLAKAVPLIIHDLKNMIAQIEKSNGDYWSSVPKSMPPRLEIRRVDRHPGIYNQPRPVICLDTLKRYPSASAAKEIGSSQGNLTMVCNGKRGSVKGFRFAYADEYEAGKLWQFVSKTRENSPRARHVICIETGEQFPTVSSAARAKKISIGHIVQVCKGKRGLTGGYKWAYLEDYEANRLPQFRSMEGRPRQVKDLETGKIYNSLTEAGRNIGMTNGGILRHCQGKVKKPRFTYAD